jgi:hypothetical protein
MSLVLKDKLLGLVQDLLLALVVVNNACYSTALKRGVFLQIELE